MLPYFHSGMARVMPYLSSLPHVGNEVTVVVGEPLDLSSVTCRWGKGSCLGAGHVRPCCLRSCCVAVGTAPTCLCWLDSACWAALCCAVLLNAMLGVAVA